GLTLVRAAWAEPEYHTGETLHLVLVWRNQQAAGDYTFGLHLLGWQGATLDALPFNLSIDAATPEWVRQQVDFPIRPYLASGQDQLVLVADQGWASLGTIPITAISPAPANSAPLIAAQAQFENGIRFLGYSQTQANQKLVLNLFWRLA